MVDLRLEDVGGHRPSGDKDDGWGLRGAGVEIVEGYAVASDEGFAFGVDGCASGGGEKCEAGECPSGSHKERNFSRVFCDSERAVVPKLGVLRLTKDLDAPTLLVRAMDDCEEIGDAW